MTYTLDTNAVIKLLRNDAAVKSHFDRAVNNGDGISIPAIVDYETLRGFLCYPAPAKERLYNSLCDRYPVEDMSADVWGRAARIYAELYRKHLTVNDADILIAALCIVNGYTLVTSNKKDFENIDGLKLVDWAK